ncbi:hypothetical protein ES702_06836 [subsurface metagenome]
MKIDFKKIFSGVLKVTSQVLSQAAYAEAAKSERVQTEVAKGKVALGKETLWGLFPFIVIGGVFMLLLKGFK